MIPTRISPPIETPIITGIFSFCGEGDVVVMLLVGVAITKLSRIKCR